MWRAPGILLALFFLAIALLVGACSLAWSPRRPDLLAPYRAAMLPMYVSDLDLPQVRSAPRYALNERLDPARKLLQGTALITVTNRSRSPWLTVVLRLFPNLEHYGGAMTVDSIIAQDVQLSYTYLADETAVLADLMRPVAPGEALSLLVAYRVTYPSWNNDAYLLFGERKGIISLPLAYPVLAIPRPDGTWSLDRGIPLGDTLTAESSLYRVQVTVPPTLTLISSAVVSTTQTYTDAPEVTYTLVSGPVREFTLLLGPDYRVAERTVRGVRVRSYYLPGDESAGQAVLTYAAAALQIYSRHFGPYPFRKMDVAAGVLLNRGMEYSTLNMLGLHLYRYGRADLEFLTAHEVAHQWWYTLVGNDQVNEPWLDEGLTEYSTYFYYEDIYGRRVAEELRRTRWLVPVEYARNQSLDAPLGLTSHQYSKENYETIVYAKGALFFHALRQRLGDGLFHQALRAYAQEYRYRIATAEDLRRVITDTTGQSVDDLFATWVGR